MSVDSNGIDLGICTAAADLSANQFYGVAVTGDFSVGLVAAINTAALGVLQNKPKAGQAALVRTQGVTKAIAGGAIAAGAKLMFNAAGLLVTAAGSTAIIVGYALQAAAVNDVFAAYLAGPGTGHVNP